MARRPSHLERNWDSLLDSYLDVAHDADGTVRTGADYVVSADSTGVYRARSMAGGTSYTHATDAANVVQSAVTALAASGGTIVLSGSLAWGSVPALPRSITGKLRIVGQGAKVTLSTAAPRLFDFNRVADYDTFQNIEISDLTVDAANIGGKHHVIVGTYIAGSNQRRVNIQGLTVRNVRAFNVLRDTNTGTNHRLGVWLVTTDAAGGNATTLNDILIENVRVEGGNAGVAVGCAISTNAVSCDRVVFRGCYHDTGVTPTATFASSNYQIGGFAAVNRCLIDECYGANSGDVGVEIDNAVDAEVRGGEYVDAQNAGLFFANFISVASQNILCKGVQTAKRNLAFANTSANGIRLGGNASANSKMGTIIVDGCQHTNTSQSFLLGDAFRAYDTNPTGGYEQIVLRNCKAYINGFSQDVTATINGWPYAIGVHSGTTLILVVDGLYVDINVTRGGGSSASLNYGALSYTGTGTVINRVQNVSGSLVQANETSTTARFLNTAVVSAAMTHRGEYRRIGPIFGSAAGRIGIRFVGTVVYQHLDVAECDFANAASAGSEFSFVTATDKGLVHLRGNNYVSDAPPVPVAFTGLVTATGKRLDTGWDAMVTFTQGSGAAITAIDYSTNGGTTYTNFLTQSSAALPAGFDQSIGPLPSDALIKVTFTTTQPTITLVPANP